MIPTLITLWSLICVDELDVKYLITTGETTFELDSVAVDYADNYKASIKIDNTYTACWYEKLKDRGELK